jgi:hypothetical protein
VQVSLAPPLKEDGLLARLGPGHDGLPLAGVEAALADVVLDRGVVLALEVLELLVEDQPLVGLDLGNLDQHDVGGLLADPSEGVRRLHVRSGSPCTEGEGGQ